MGTLFAKVVKIIDQHDWLLRYPRPCSKVFQELNVQQQISHEPNVTAMFLPFESWVYPLFCRTLQSYKCPGYWAIQTIHGFSTSCQNRIKTFFVFGGGFLKVTSQRRHVLKILATFGQPWASTHCPFFYLKVLLKTGLKSASVEPWIDLLAYL